MEIYDFGNTAYLPGASALVELADSSEMIGKTNFSILPKIVFYHFTPNR